MRETTAPATLRAPLRNTSDVNPTAERPHLPWFLTGLTLGLALPLMVALWSAAALWFDAPAPWMAIVVAADASLLLQLLRFPEGRRRAGLAMAFLGLATLASLWLLVAGIAAPAFGLMPWESALRLGPVLFTSIAGGWLTAPNLLWLAAAAALSLWWNR